MNKISFLDQLMAKPSKKDALILSLFVVLVTLHPFYLHGTLNLFELGLYLPGIDAIRHGQMPYRDFFYLRGPFELYMPALLMNMCGDQVAVLSSYFYAGTVLLFITAVLAACMVIKNRFVLYCAVPVLVARTFPRVVFTYWGGMRFVIGLLGVVCLIRFCRDHRGGWLAALGVLTAVGLLTSIEIGVCLAAAVIGVLLLQGLGGRPKREVGKSFSLWGSAFAAVVLPYVFYLYFNGALSALIDCVTTVATRVTATFLQTEVVPNNVGEVLQALFIPTAKNFRQMTPVFCYLAFAGYIGLRLRRRCCDWLDYAAVGIALYGLTMYVFAFRNLWASQFEMALVPSKLILFFLLSKVFVYVRSAGGLTARWKTTAVLICLLAVFVSSIPYAVGRYQKRFFVFRLKGDWVNPPQVPRLKGSSVSPLQARDMTMLKYFLDKHSSDGERVFMFPELGAVGYIVQRPGVGRFPMATMSWLKEQWHQELRSDLKSHPPRWAVLQKQIPDYFQTAYFPIAANLRKYRETVNFIQRHYTPVFETPSFRVWRYNHS